MTWNSTWPINTLSVKANQVPGNQNTVYIETNMGNSVVGTNTVTTRDHFWNVDANLDGRHRFIQSPAFTEGGNPADPVVGTSMDGVIFIKQIKDTVQGFYRNNPTGSNTEVYQFIPAYRTGTVTISGSTWKDIGNPMQQNVYGEIYLYQNIDKSKIQKGYFSTSTTTAKAYSIRNKETDTSNTYYLELRNDQSNNLTLNIRLGDRGPINDGIWNWKLIYWAQ
jgi:hypothetical protein